MSPLIFASTEQPAQPACELKGVVTELGGWAFALLIIWLIFR